VSPSWLLGLVLALGSSCHRPEPLPPDLLVFLVPGLRADTAESPSAEAAFLAPFEPEPLRRFTAAYAQSASPWVSLGSMMVGRYPSAIPLCGRVGKLALAEQPWCSTLPETRPSLPEILRLYGYHSALIQSGPGDSAELGDRFGEVQVLPAIDGRSNWAALGLRLEALWERPEPVFAVVVLGDLAVQDRPDLRQDMGLPGQPSRCEQAAQRLGHPRLDGGPGVEEATSPVEPGKLSPAGPVIEPSCTLDTWDPTVDGLEGPPVPSYPWGTVELDRVRSVYADEAARVGQGIHGLLAVRDPSPEPWVVLAGLHGISMGEVSGVQPMPKTFACAQLLLDRTVRVPLAFMGPGVAAADLTQPVELLDLMPTLLARTEALPPALLPGQDLLAPGFALDASAAAYAEFGDMLYLRQGAWSLTLRTVSHRGTALDPSLTARLQQPVADSAFHLYRVDRDPFQQRELKAEQAAMAKQLRQRMIDIRIGPGAPPEELMDAERSMELRLQGSEGYW